jgi:hypothetical protein
MNQPTSSSDPSGAQLIAYSESTAIEMQKWLANDKSGYWQQAGPGITTVIEKLDNMYILVPLGDGACVGGLANVRVGLPLYAHALRVNPMSAAAHCKRQN